MLVVTEIRISRIKVETRKCLIGLDYNKWFKVDALGLTRGKTVCDQLS